MTQNVYSNEGVINAFAEQNQNNGRNKQNSIFFEFNNIYSYGHHFLIAHIEGRKAFVTDEKHSVTTSRHTSKVALTLSKHGYEIIRGTQ